MEMGSSSFTESGGSSSSPPNSFEFIDGLKFGQKIYFEDVGFGAPPKSGGGSSSFVGSGGSKGVEQPRKGRGGVVQGGQPPRCIVEGCNVDLSDAKAYYSRHKVCGIHSKTPIVIVAGLEQRFCQQCSRFHRLPEFDQGKRSCRRRLAGHNERRRKLSPGSILSSRYGRLPSSIFENSGRGSFLMDFTAYPKQSVRDKWQTTKSMELEPGNQSTATRKFPMHQWHGNSENPPFNLFQHGSTDGVSFPGPEIPLGECITGATDSSCALSLLSNQPRSSDLGANNLINPEGAPTAQLTAPQGAAVDHHFQNSPWGFKVIEVGTGAHKMPPDLDLGHILQPVSYHFSNELELSQQSKNHRYMELQHSRAYDSTQQMHWSL